VKQGALVAEESEKTCRGDFCAHGSSEPSLVVEQTDFECHATMSRSAAHHVALAEVTNALNYLRNKLGMSSEVGFVGKQLSRRA